MKSHWFWGRQLGKMTHWGLWWRQRVFIGISKVQEGEPWTIEPKEAQPQ